MTDSPVMRQGNTAPPRCGRIMLGEGGDTWDPTCDLAEGHHGGCKSTAATTQNWLSLVGRVYCATDPRGGPTRIVVMSDCRGVDFVRVENDRAPYRPRKIKKARLLSSAYRHIDWTPSFRVQAHHG